MCGIFALLNIVNMLDLSQNKNQELNIVAEFMKGRSRGPEFSKLETCFINKNIVIG